MSLTSTRRIASLTCVAIAGALVAACTHPETHYESTVLMVSRHDVQKDSKGEVTIADFELEWDPCPGDQFEFVRGGREFSACMKKYSQGDYLPVNVVHYWDSHGFYRWDVYRVGDCTRIIEPDSEGTYDRSQRCTNHDMHGEASGFDCDRHAPQRLLLVCPWLARR